MKKIQSSRLSLALRIRLWWLLFRYRRFVLTTHARPDGDAVGSVIALFLFLKKKGKNALVLLEEALEPKYSFLLGWDEVKTAEEDFSVSDDTVVFVLDSGDISRTGKVAPLLKGVRLVVNIDHHKDNTAFGDVNWVNEKASSVGEMLFEWFGWWCSADIAQALLLSVATDTGFFRFSNAGPQVLRIAARLLERKAKQTVVYESIYQNRPFEFLQLVGRLIEHIELHWVGRLAIGYVAYRDMVETNCFETEGLLEYLALIRGVEVYILLKEREERKISVSFRTKGEYDMSELAHQFGGGGHVKAAGCTVEGDILEWKRIILEETLSYLEGK